MHLKFSSDGQILLAAGYERLDKYIIYAFKKQDDKYF